MEAVNISLTLLCVYASMYMRDYNLLERKPALCLLLPYAGAGLIIAFNMFFRYGANIAAWNLATKLGVFLGCTLLLGTLVALPILMAIVVNSIRKRKAAK